MISRADIRPVWAEINLDYLKHNIQEVRRVVKKGTQVAAVIKADGYGHGASVIAKTLLENGADRIAVATLTEAVELRNKGYREIPLMVLGYTPEEQAQQVLEKNIIQTIYSIQQAEAFSRIAEAGKGRIKVHLKLDTGMSRLGFAVNAGTIDEIKRIIELPGLIVEGIFTHFAMADETNKAFTYKQFEEFMYVVNEVEKAGYKIPIKHVSNSAAIIDLPEMNLDMVRAGIMLYGLYPSEEVSHEAVQLKQVMALKARVSHVKQLPAGSGISYGLRYRTQGESQIITLPVGYADGFTRMLTDKAEVMVKGQRIPIVGRICMDQCMADATGLEVKRGDEVTLFSSSPDSEITVDDIAKKLNTINYEIVCMVGRRVPRVYLENNTLLHVRDSLLE